jgi:SAM-dependent methyltransferase
MKIPVSNFKSVAKDLIAVATSGFFDRRFYEDENPDVPRGVLASLRHFLAHGGVEGRAPSRRFDSAFYLRRYSDVKSTGINPLLHFLRFGRSEERAPTLYDDLRARGYFRDTANLEVFIEALSQGKKSKGNPVDVSLLQLFGDQQPERREVRRLVADVFLAGTGIEVGALQDPLPVEEGVTVKYVDRFSKAQLYEQYPELRGAPLVEVDIVDNGEVLASLPAQSQDFVIANHFLEHTQDPIATLKNFRRVVKPGGWMYIAVPDQTSTFDRDRTPTSLDHIIADHREGPRISRHQHFVEWVTKCEPHFGRVYQGHEIDMRVKELEDKDYSIHFHCWAPDGFKDLLSYCADEVGFRIAFFARCPGEVVVVLKVM